MLGNLQICSDTYPVSWLYERTNVRILSKLEKLCGTLPWNKLELASKTLKFLSDPISYGKHPDSLLFESIISFKLYMLPIDRGMQPLKLLLANVTTETVEYPIVSGMLDQNLLWFKKSASSFISKSAHGNSPSKLLYRRSRYLRVVQDKTTLGKEPTSLLLLTSNSYISFQSNKLSGIIPQNLLELT